MTRTLEELAMVLIENGYISAHNPIKLPPDNDKLFDCEFVWYDDINNVVKSVNWSYRIQGEPDLNKLEKSCIGVSPMRCLQLLRTIKAGL